MKRIVLTLGLMALALSAAAATPTPPAAPANPVAVLAGVDGTVMVNQGERYVSASSGTVLSPGDRVMVMAGSKASIVFSADNCALALGANVVTSIPAQSTCAGGVADVHKFGPSYAQAVGSSATDASPKAKREAGWCEDEDANGEIERDKRCVALWIGGGVVAAAIIANQINDHKSSRTVSR